MHTVRISSGKEFAATDGESLLDAALRADVVLPYSCRTGRCSTCKAKVHFGSTTALHDEIGLSDTERASQWILTCVRTAQSEVALEIEDLSELHLLPAKTLPFRINSLELLSEDVMRVRLRLPPLTVFNYRAGQYVEIIGRDGLRRSYSIANSPKPDNVLELHIKRVLGGEMSRYWFEQANVDDTLRLSGPLGTFFLRDIAGVDLIFLATGTGIAPIKAMLETLAVQKDGQPRSISVFWGGRVFADIYWDVHEAGTELQNFSVLSRASSDWEGNRGYVQHACLRLPHDWSNTTVYACGSEAMINDAKQRLIAAGLSHQRFFSDAFVCSGIS